MAKHVLKHDMNDDEVIRYQKMVVKIIVINDNGDVKKYNIKKGMYII